MPSYPAIPPPRPHNPDSLLATVQALKEAVEILIGSRGLKTAHAITVGSLPAAVGTLPPGASGTAGARGAVGQQGDDGEPGERGFPGAPGVDGQPGMIGRPGDDGDDGPMGPPGLPGVMGIIGYMGPPGADGEDGSGGSGPPGVSSAIDPITYNGGVVAIRNVKFSDSDQTTVVGNTSAQGNATASAFSVAVGYQALNALTTGTKNVAVGASALALNTIGVQNTAVGSGALAANTADNNVAVGDVALAANTSGTFNTACGTAALQSNTTVSNNSAFGVLAAGANKTGTRNTAIGGQALTTSVTGDNNTAVGQNSLAIADGAGNNTCIGRAAGSTITSGGNNICIGSGMTVAPTASNQLNIGDLIWGTGVSGSNAGGIGIGTSAPDARFVVFGTVGGLFTRIVNSDFVAGVSGSGILILPGATSGDTYTRIAAFKTGFAAWGNLTLQDGGGFVGIGTIAPVATIHTRADGVNTKTTVGYFQNGSVATTDGTQSTRVGFIPGSLFTAAETLAPYIEAVMDNHTSAQSSLRIGAYTGSGSTIEIAQFHGDGTSRFSGFINSGGFVRVSTQFDKTNDVTLANVPGLSVNVLAGKTYMFTAMLHINAGVGAGNGGAQIAMAGTCTATAIIAQTIGGNNGTSGIVGVNRLTALGGTTNISVAGASYGVIVKGLITVNAAGTLTIQFAQNSSTATASSVLVGSTLEVKEVT